MPENTVNIIISGQVCLIINGSAATKCPLGATGRGEKMRKRENTNCYLLVAMMIFFAGCSTSHTYKVHGNLNELTEREGYQLKVKSGNYSIDKAIYAAANKYFGQRIPIKKNGPFGGIINITFSAGKQTYIGVQPGFETNQNVRECWYSGNGYEGNDKDCKLATEVVSGSLLTWQNALMVIMIKDMDNNVFWSADYTYRGGYELSGFVVNSADKAAELSIKRLAGTFDIDFKLVPPPTTSTSSDR